MDYTISDMLRDNLVPGIEQLAYGGDLASAEIAAVTVQEYPADDFVQPGDLVLSTAEGCTDDPQKFAAFLDELAQSGACGVLFAFRDASYRFPLALRLHAQQKGLPVFRIPWKLRFAQVQTELIRRIHRRNVEYLTEHRLKDDFVWNLAFGSPADPQQTALQGMRLKFDLSLNYSCMRFRAALPDEAAEYSSRAAQAASRIENAIEASARLCGLKCMYAARSLEFILYVQARAGREEEDAQAVLARLRETLAQELPDAAFFFGVSPAEGSPSNFAALAQQAGMALAYAAGTPDGCYTYKDAKEAAMIAALLRNAETADIARETLAPLLAADEKGGDYLKSAAVYFRCCGNASRAAEELNIHRITLLQRLEKIEALTGLSLKDHRDRLLLQLCVRMAVDG
ncbi:MAG: PucR family transcriptional regulator ligand-binding domain-containing protein [Clostridia bacterium]|nr:PucR family transcriptional regulator ligand-binding domain-containing protein [Clostridia bacterium]